MMMTEKYLLDTNIISELLRGSGKRYEAIAAWLAATRKPLGISAISLYEILSGLRSKNMSNLERIFYRLIAELSIKVLDVDETIAEGAAAVRAEAAKSGRIYHVEDLLIGCTAQRFGYTLATANTKDFESWCQLINPLKA